MFAELVGRENVIAGTDCSRVPSANRLGQAPRPVRRRGDREQEVVELNSRVPVQDERNKKQKSLEVKVRPLLSSPRRQNTKREALSAQRKPMLSPRVFGSPLTRYEVRKSLE